MKFRCCHRLLCSSLVAVSAFSLLAAGCGGASSPRVASVASSTTVATTAQNGLVGYTRCMRSHGVPAFPDPDRSGRIPKSQVVSARASAPTRFDAASTACGPLAPGGLGGSVQITRAEQTDYLKAAACMRRHGVPDFPDPTFRDNGVKFTIPSSINAHSSQVLRALPICRKLIPAGLPYSGTS